MALIVVMGVMNGLQNDLRDKILIASPHLRILTYGEGLRLDDWATVRTKVLAHQGVVAGAPFVLSQGLISTNHDYAEGCRSLGSSLTPEPRPSRPWPSISFAETCGS